jgi:putative transposase
LIERKNKDVSVKRQCELLSVHRSAIYSKQSDPAATDLELMRLIDEQYLKTPFYGSRRMAAHLRRLGHPVNRKRVRRLMRTMGLVAIYQKPRTSVPAPEHKKYPYLLGGLTIDRPGQVSATDVTYIPMAKGFLYLVAIMDWHSRFILGWRLSNSLEATFCVEALQDSFSYGLPEIMNSDQGSQFTCEDFIDTLKDAGVAISMDGKGRCMDNIFVERLWRSLKYEEVYLHAYESVQEAKQRIGAWIEFYNFERVHQALAYKTPWEVFSGQESTGTISISDDLTQAATVGIAMPAPP